MMHRILRQPIPQRSQVLSRQVHIELGKLGPLLFEIALELSVGVKPTFALRNPYEETATPETAGRTAVLSFPSQLYQRFLIFLIQEWNIIITLHPIIKRDKETRKTV